MRTFNKTWLIELFKEKDIAKLPYYLSKTETKIYHRIESGEPNSTAGMKKLKMTRNYLRKLLLLKLLEWYNKRGKENKPDNNYAEIQEEKQLKRFYDDISSKEKFKELLNACK